MRPSLIDNSIHFEELERNIKALQRMHVRNGMGGAYVVSLCDLLLEDVENYFIKTFKFLSNEITAGKNPQLESPNRLFGTIENETNNIQNSYMEILLREIRTTLRADKETEQAMLKSLSFPEKFVDKIRSLRNKFKAQYTEQLVRKTNEEMRLKIEKSALAMAEKANKIAHSNRIAVWIFGVVSNLTAISAFLIAIKS